MKKIRPFAAVMAALMLCSCSSQNAGNSDISQNKHGSQAQDAADLPEESTGHEGDMELVYAVYSEVSESEQAVIDRFNAADNGFTVTVMPVSWIGENSEDGVTDDELRTGDFRLIQEIINSDTVDIVSGSSFLNSAKMEILEKKGAFADLYKFMARDVTVNKSALNEHILSLSETDGKLCHLPVWYEVHTMIADSRYVGSKTGWTVKEFKKCWEKASKDGATFNGNTAGEYVYMNTLRENLPNYIDFENAAVHFDCDEFRDMLEFCSQFKSIGKNKDEHDSKSPMFVAPRILRGFRDAYEYFSDKGDYTVMGFPVNSGCGAYFVTTNYAVVANKDPERQRGSWEFIKMFADYEYQSENYVSSYTDEETGKTDYSEEFHFPVNNRVFDEKVKDVMNGEYVPEAYDHFTGELVVHIPTQSECDRLIAYIGTVDRLDSRLDRALWEIINEEVMSYLAGENSLDRCIDLIQNRTSIWVSEQS